MCIHVNLVQNDVNILILHRNNGLSFELCGTENRPWSRRHVLKKCHLRICSLLSLLKIQFLHDTSFCFYSLKLEIMVTY